jgi:excisionase family DNA binding protein
MADKGNFEPLLTIEEAAEALAVKQKSVWNFVYSRRIRSVLIGRCRRIPASAIRELLERGTVTAAL